MSSREIAELLGARHDNVKVTVERLANRGTIEFPATQDIPTATKPVRVYLLDKRSSLIVVAHRPIVTRGTAGRPVANSRDVAAYFGKPHNDVLKAVRALLSQAPAAEGNFSRSEYRDPTGRPLPCFDMDRDGFTLLAMGFTGPKALQFKMAYIAEFNAMEAELESRYAASEAQGVSSVLRAPTGTLAPPDLPKFGGVYIDSKGERRPQHRRAPHHEQPGDCRADGEAARQRPLRHPQDVGGAGEKIG